MRKSELYFEELGENFDAFMSDYDVVRRGRLISRLLSLVELKGKALEVGCGTGALTPTLFDRGLDITVGDISQSLAEATAQKYTISSMRCDATSIALPNEAVDVVLSSEVIEHVPDPHKALREMARVLKPGGSIVVTSPNKLWYPVLWLSMKFGVRKFSGNEIWLWPMEAAKVLEGENIHVIKVTGCHLFPWQIPGAKKILPFFDALGDLLWPFMINWGILGRKG